MDVIVERCAGLDVHRDDVVATVRVPGVGRRQWDQQTRTFRATLAGLSALGEWLTEFGVTLVGMEATGVYWKTVFQALEDRLRVLASERASLAQRPGAQDRREGLRVDLPRLVAAWACAPELRAASGDPSAAGFDASSQGADQRARPLDPAAGEGSPRRRDQAHERRIAYVLEVRARDAQSALVRRHRPGAARPARKVQDAREDPAAARGACQAAFRSSITGSGRAVAPRTSTRSTPRSQSLSARIEIVLAPHAQIIELLCTIPGIQTHAAEVLIAECGLDMSRFPTVGHFASWAGACPGHHESAGRRRSGRTCPGPRWLTHALTEAAKAAARTKGTYLAAHFAQVLRGRRGEPKAIGAIRHDILVAYYHIVRDQVPFRELGPDWQRKRYSAKHRARRLQRQLEALGYTVTLNAIDEVQPAV